MMMFNEWFIDDQSAVPKSFLDVTVLCSSVAVGLKSACLVHDGKMPALNINAVAIIIFFMVL
jgi:hypothetical protein